MLRKKVVVKVFLYILLNQFEFFLNLNGYDKLVSSTSTSNINSLLIFSKDVRLPVQLQRAMAAEAEAAREARAKVDMILTLI